MDGQYVPIELTHEAEGVVRGYSDVLELSLCWDSGMLKFYDQGWVDTSATCSSPNGHTKPRCTCSNLLSLHMSWSDNPVRLLSRRMRRKLGFVNWKRSCDVCVRKALTRSFVAMGMQHNPACECTRTSPQAAISTQGYCAVCRSASCYFHTSSSLAPPTLPLTACR